MRVTKDLSKLFFFFGGYLAEVEVHGEDEHGELGGGGAGPERGGDGLGGGGGLGRAVTLNDSIKDLGLSRQACKLSFIIRVTGKFVAFSLSVLSFVFLGGGGWRWMQASVDNKRFVALAGRLAIIIFVLFLVSKESNAFIILISIII